ncbi:MAG TPA: AI-2E family transporter [Candidatus Saccharimonadales bacterium]|jgi:predicted PurR-regulated permease PerM
MFKRFKKDTVEETEVTISNKTVLRVLALVIGAFLLLAAIQQAASSLILIFTAFFLALALNGPVQGIARRLPGSLRGKRSVATAISFLVVVLFFVGFLASIVPPLIKQTESFVNSVPQLVRDAHDQDSEIGSLIRRYRLEGQLNTASNDIGEKLQGIGGSALSTVAKVGSSLFAILTILVLTFMMLIEGPKVLAFFRELVPPKKRRHADRLAGDMYRVVKGFINGQVTLAALAAILIFPAFFILDISYPVALMVIVFICGLIPMFGHTIGAVIVTLVALATSPLAAIIIFGYYILYQQIENYIVQPRIQANSTNMSPLLVFISVVIGIKFGGLFGGLFAIPVAGCIRIAVLDYLVNHEYINNTETPVIDKTAEEAKA